MRQGRRFVAFLAGDPQADRAVPPTGFTASLTLLTSGAMAFLAVFALALALATGRLAERWGEELAESATLRLPPAEGDAAATQVAAALRVLDQTPGVGEARALTADENRALLEPWLGPDLPLEALPVPQLVAVTLDGEDFDAEGLRARLAAEVPGAVLDDHTAWRAPLVVAAGRMRALGWLSLLLIAGSTGAMITLAAQAALAANAQVIRVLRLVGARDITIARAFVRRFTLRAGWGAAAGTLAGMLAILLLPSADESSGGFLTGLGFQGAGWLAPLVIPVLAAGTAFAATRAAALRTLRTQS
ncbi:cell division protein FtsX [Rubellimicrobium aerolatum]|uniref:Cell division protein FtsX n=1 Tax=Rubellimicrobium aerolatum TaxID=490979 RepID=A0ABW0SCQ5_9RHOB